MPKNSAGSKDRKHRRGKYGVRPGTHEGGTWWAMLAELKQIANKTKVADSKAKKEAKP